MAENRRLFIDQSRLIHQIDFDRKVELTSHESHYLFRVMRLKFGDSISIVDGKGHLWNAIIEGEKLIRLTTLFKRPLQSSEKEKPLICIAVAIPKQGFDNFLQMSCEMGIDIIQPIISERSILKEYKNEKFIRWKKIIHEAVEQSERLWVPELRQILRIQDWLDQFSSHSHIAFAATRIDGLKDLAEWLNERPNQLSEVWIAIGPEGGWNNNEEKLVFESGISSISMGKTILRTSTAAVGACQLMISWRRLRQLLS